MIESREPFQRFASMPQKWPTYAVCESLRRAMHALHTAARANHGGAMLRGAIYERLWPVARSSVAYSLRRGLEEKCVLSQDKLVSDGSGQEQCTFRSQHCIRFIWHCERYPTTQQTGESKSRSSVLSRHRYNSDVFVQETTVTLMDSLKRTPRRARNESIGFFCASSVTARYHVKVWHFGT